MLIKYIGEDHAVLLYDVTGSLAYNVKANCYYFCKSQSLRYEYLAGFAASIMRWFSEMHAAVQISLFLAS